jgi:hypothetical protein
MKVSTEQWWSETNSEKPKYLEKTLLFQSHSVGNKSYTDWPGSEQGPPWWQAGLSA